MLQTTSNTLGDTTPANPRLYRTYVNETSFDDLGRPLTFKYPTGFIIRYAYSSAGSGRTPGILQQVSDNANAARIFWRIDTLPAGQVFDAQGHLKSAALGNGVLIDNHYDPISGKAFALKAGVGGSTSTIACLVQTAKCWRWSVLVAACGPFSTLTPLLAEQVS